MRVANGPVTWWESAHAPRQWSVASPVVGAALPWRDGCRGVSWAELELEGSGEAARLRLIVVRLDPARLRLGVLWGVGEDARPAWSLRRVPRDACFAVNAGQFVSSLPWGWVVAGGVERLSPGHGPLSSALIVHRDGTVRMLDGDALDAPRRDSTVIAAFQSYPTLLRTDGAVPAALFAPCAIDCAHRDARLAIGVDRAGHVLVAMTRFDAVGASLGFIPLGLTVPEMAAVMGAVGAAQAVLLDGGISAQMLVRDDRGVSHTWPGVRRVPLALAAWVR